MARFELALLLADRRAVLALSRLIGSGVDPVEALDRVFFSLEFPDLDGLAGEDRPPG